jgi:hypothetical protein
VFRADKTDFLISMFVAFARGLPPAEQARIVFGPKVKAVHSALVEQALVKAGVRR